MSLESNTIAEGDVARQDRSVRGRFPLVPSRRRRRRSGGRRFAEFETASFEKRKLKLSACAMKGSPVKEMDRGNNEDKYFQAKPPSGAASLSLALRDLEEERERENPGCSHRHIVVPPLSICKLRYVSRCLLSPRIRKRRTWNWIFLAKVCEFRIGSRLFVRLSRCRNCVFTVCLPFPPLPSCDKRTSVSYRIKSAVEATIGRIPHTDNSG